MPVRVETDGGVAVVTIDRAEALNALDVETLGELRDRLRELGREDAVRCVVVTGAGEKAFVAGADIAYMFTLSPEGARSWGALGHAAADLLEQMPKPTIAAVNGFALGGGCELALACDVRYCSSRARFGQPEVGLGIIPGWGGTQRLARATNPGFAKELILSGRLVGAEEALRVGLVQAVHDPVLEHALVTARLVAAKAPAALRAAKELVNRASGAGYQADLRAEVDAFGELFATEDAAEGLAAFVDKREPRFTGR